MGDNPPKGGVIPHSLLESHGSSRKAFGRWRTDPIVGLWYRQEYRKGEAEDVGQVMSLNETVTVPAGTFTNCVKIAEWNPLEPGILEHDFYAPGIGSVREVAVKGESGFEDLSEFNIPEN